MVKQKPIGTVTRGTTNPNRLRRIDRFLVNLKNLRTSSNPIVVDLGFGASPITAIELLGRCLKVNQATIVVGVEIERDRVNNGLAVAHEQLRFQLGGFETPLPEDLANRKVDIIRALNVLRQYDESQVAAAWNLMQSRLTSEGWLIEGTCDELGRYASWVTLNSERPNWFTIAVSVSHIERPSKVQERLPKALIHHNVPGEKIHDYLQALDKAWLAQAPIGSFSAVQRWVAMCDQLKAEGWPVRSNQKRHKLGEITIDWEAVAPK